MAYTPTDWQTGNIITAAKLNNMEDGIENALEKTGGTVTGDIVMSGDAELQGNTQTSTTFLLQNLPEAADLNEYKVPGFFGVQTGLIANTILNKPNLAEGTPFSVLVLPWYNTQSTNVDPVFQILFSGDTNVSNGVKIFVRSHYEGAWPTNWFQFNITASSVETAMAAAYREGVESIA